MEIWRDIEGYENLYQVSNEGRVRSCERYRKGKNNSIVRVNERILKPGKNSKGYCCIVLCSNKNNKSYLVHRLVADAFIPNPNNLPEINHIDEDKSNNIVENLEWCNTQYNIEYTHNKPVYSVNKTTNEITYYKSIKNAGIITNVSKQSIGSCCRGKQKTAGGYKWYYMN